MPTYTVDEIKHLVGNGIAKLIHDAVPEGTPDELYRKVLATFKEHYADHSLDTTAPYPGVVDAIDRLRAAGVSALLFLTSPTLPSQIL